MPTKIKRNNSWYLQYYYDGKQVRKSLKTSDEKIADVALAKLTIKLDRINAGVDVYDDIKKRVILSDFYDKLTQHISARHSIRTAETYNMHLKTFYNYAKDKIQYADQLKRSLMENYITERKKNISDRTCANTIQALKAIFNIAIKLDLLENNPAIGIKIKYAQKKPFFWSREELQKIFDSSSPLFRDIFELLYYTGLRKGELANLKWENIDFRNKLLVIREPAPGRTAAKMKPRKIPLHNRAMEIINRLYKNKKHEQLLFVSKNNRIHSHNVWAEILRRTKKKADITNGSLHTFRHTFASHLVEKGVDLYLVSKWLGHSSIKMTEIYAHLKPENYGHIINDNLF